jgi:hypothetical protein
MNASCSARRLAIGVLAIFSLACGSDAVTASGSPIVGTYSLRTVNGAALPVTVTDSLEGVPVLVTYMSPTSFTLGSDNSVRIITTLRVVLGSINQVQTDTLTGTYALRGLQVTFSRPGSTSFTAAWNGSDALTLVDGETFVFKK